MRKPYRPLMWSLPCCGARSRLSWHFGRSASRDFGGTSREAAGATVGRNRPTTSRPPLDGPWAGTPLRSTSCTQRPGWRVKETAWRWCSYGIGTSGNRSARCRSGARFGAGARRVSPRPASIVDFDGRAAQPGGAARGNRRVPLARACHGIVTGERCRERIVFDPADAPSGVGRRATRRLGVALGLRYQP